MVAAVDTMFSGQNIVPWHGLGKVVQGAANANEALDWAGLNWTVAKEEIKVIRNNKIVTAQNHFAIVREDNDTVLGVVKGRYTTLQNSQALDFFDSVVTRDEAIYHTAGSLNGGRRVWLLAKLPDHIRVGKDDLIEKYVLIALSHDGTSPLFIKVTPIRVVCQNTLNAALSGGGAVYVIRHTSGIHDKVKEAARAMGFINTMYQDLNEAYNKMQNTQMTSKDMVSYLERCYGLTDGGENKALKNTMQLVEVGRGADMARGTLWGTYNAVVEYVDYKGYRTNDTRLENIWFGSGGQKIKEKAYMEAVALL